MTGMYPIETPSVLGHEGAGEVVGVGPGVTDLEIDGHVIATGVTQCGRRRFRLTGEGIRAHQSQQRCRISRLAHGKAVRGRGPDGCRRPEGNRI